jgi:hypothetical protein
LPARTWEITRSFFNYPLFLPAPFLITRSFFNYPLFLPAPFLITRSFYPRPAPFTRSPLQIDTPQFDTHTERFKIKAQPF